MRLRDLATNEPLLAFDPVACRDSRRSPMGGDATSQPSVSADSGRLVGAETITNRSAPLREGTVHR